MKSNVAGVAPAVDLDVGGLVGADGHVVERQVGHAHEQVLEGHVRVGGLGLEPGDLVLLLGHERAQAFEFGLVALGLGGADLFARGVALGERVLGGLDPGAAGLVEAEDRLRHRLQPAPRQTLVEGVRRLADRADVVHGGVSRRFAALMPDRRAGSKAVFQRTRRSQDMNTPSRSDGPPGRVSM